MVNSLLFPIRKVTLVSLLVLFMTGCGLAAGPAEAEEQTDPPETPREMRGLWIATVANIDWPSEPGLSTEQQQRELIAMLDRAAALNLNAVIFQIRPAGDALYDSPYEPWSPWLTGEMGKAPDPWYDPLEFAVSEAHKRGMELHAWLNPYRVYHPSDPGSGFTPDHITQTHPELVREYGDYRWLDPALEEVRELTLRVILDVVERYNVDAIHLDDYFYPYPSYAAGADFPDDESWEQAREQGVTMTREDWRRDNVNGMMKEIYDAIGEVDSKVRFGLSPFGVWRPGHPEETFGLDAYSELYADSRHWIREGWIDYFSPQIYYPIAEATRPFPVMLEWWVEQNLHDRHLWPGMRTRSVLLGQDPFYPDDPGWPSDEIVGKVYISRSNPDVSGSLHYSTEPLMVNPDRLVEKLAAGPYARPALAPAYPWIDETLPPAPAVELREHEGEQWLLLTPESSLQEHEIRWWAVRSLYGDRWQLDLVPGPVREHRLVASPAGAAPHRIVVSLIDRLGNESRPAGVDLPFTGPVGLQEKLEELPGLIRRSQWSESEPGGTEALASRVRLGAGDQFDFRDLTLSVGSSKAGDCPQGEALLDAAAGYATVNGEMCNPDRITLQLTRYHVNETVELMRGEARNWYGYQVALVDLDRRPDEAFLADLEITATGSIDVQRYASMELSPERIRVPHRVTGYSLHDTGLLQELWSNENPAESFRALKSNHITINSSWDIPYHLIIAPDGSIFEGRNLRYSGDPDRAGDQRGRLLLHLAGVDSTDPTPEQQEALNNVTEWVEETVETRE